MRYQYYTADVFTDRPFGGNQLAVFPDARGLNTALMQHIAAEFNYSESTFVFPPQDAQHTRRVRIFTPSAEMPFAGHPTVGTAHVLAAIGEIALNSDVTHIVFEEGVGAVKVAIHARAGKPVFCQLSAAQLPEFGPPAPAVDLIAAALSLNASDILSGADFPQAVSCGVPFLFVPLRNIDAVRRARINMDRWEKHIALCWARWIYLFSYEVERAGSQVHARMFAPALGIAEDPATGAACTALAGYLGERDATRDGTLRWRVEQGFEMGRHSILEVEADKAGGGITAIRVGGASVMMAQGCLDVPVD
ncbi:MAG: PhzF family phenazine biosynthesis protein [Chloroflexi bacterium]|nr:PhzF family phenazine biosynthesis protein [Chloroflexota bacterium]MCL5276000.1 PhzF family phenazine biosynthesis protein [Chloroflexota bacterium]